MMNDRDEKLRLTDSQMIRRAARASRRMTLEERIELIKYSEGESERVKARFARPEGAKPAP